MHKFFWSNLNKTPIEPVDVCGSRKCCDAIVTPEPQPIWEPLEWHPTCELCQQVYLVPEAPSILQTLANLRIGTHGFGGSSSSDTLGSDYRSHNLPEAEQFRICQLEDSPRRSATIQRRRQRRRRQTREAQNARNRMSAYDNFDYEAAGQSAPGSMKRSKSCLIGPTTAAASESRARSCDRTKVQALRNASTIIKSQPRKMSTNLSCFSTNMSHSLVNRLIGPVECLSKQKLSKPFAHQRSQASASFHSSLFQLFAHKSLPCVDAQSHLGDVREPRELRRRGRKYHPGSSALSASPSTDSFIATKIRDFRHDMQRILLRLRSRSEERCPSRESADDTERPMKGPDLLSRQTSLCQPEPQTDQFQSLHNGSIVARAQALVDFTPSPYDKGALRFKRGDLIEVISMNPSGLWMGRVNGRIGHFKFITVQLMPDKPDQKLMRNAYYSPKVAQDLETCFLDCRTAKPETVEDFLKLIGLKEHISVFVLNGYEELSDLLELNDKELDYLGIMDAEERAKIFWAVDNLLESDSDTSIPKGRL